MLREFETTLELAGELLACRVMYERDPSDGHVIIYSVTLIECGLEITKALKDWQNTVLEGQIEAECAAAIAAYQAERADCRRIWRSAA